MSLKSDFQCSICSKIFLNPIHLPCNCDSICAEHLKDHDVHKSNKIKCNSCNQTFTNLNDLEFKSNKRLQSLLNKEIHLSDDEKTLKASLEESIKVFFQLLN